MPVPLPPVPCALRPVSLAGPLHFGPCMGGKPRVLLVEDNADVRRLYAIGLNQRGYEVKLAANGAEAVDRVAMEHPDYILLDWMMPLMDGHEVLERLDRQPGTGGIVIIVISGQPAPSALPPRIRSWLTKPLTVDELVFEMTHPKMAPAIAHTPTILAAK